MFWYTFLIYLTFASGQLNENFKDQYCVDPRTFKKHAANTEWADAYSCTRHKCQPSGRKLAMYTVGCKRVEKPESAIECEEVVEDTNMQFPYCCTRLRCLVVVQGEVWTKVLGQPWETLPTAPWSHMYKKKRPPPIDEKILLKAKDQQGPIYELHTEDTEEPKKATNKNILRALKSPVGKSKTNSESDVVIALTTDNGEKRVTKGHRSAGYKKVSQAYDSDSEYDSVKERATDDNDINEKNQHPWSRIPQKQWSEKETLDEADNELQSEKKVEGSDLQSLVDAIETRMRDIEDVVQRMNQNIVSKKPANVERRYDTDSEEKRERLLAEEKYQYDEKNKTDYDFYGRHKTKNNDAEYLHISEDITAEADIGNSIFKKLYTERDEEKEPMLTYIMAPVDNGRKSSKTDTFEKTKHKKHAHRSKGKGKKHKKHHDKKEAKKHSHKHSYIESDKDFLSFEDSVETPI